jgi:NAD(P)-dependent dehydrogenase (short-subunit alcohol dehydrogenase family)
MTTLQNKTALVTGASRGIGRATASALAKAGAHVLVHYGRSTQEAESLVAEIQTKGGRADEVSADLGTPDGASLLANRYAPSLAIDWMCLCSTPESARQHALRITQ